MAGRRTVLTLERRALIVRLMSSGVSRNRAAQAIGCAPSTITYGTLRDPQFRAAVLKARAVHAARQARLAAAALAMNQPSCAEPQKCGLRNAE